MGKLERYEIEQSPDRIVIRVNQKRNAAVNMAVSLILLGLSAYLIATTAENSSFYYVLLGIGILWFMAAVYGYRLERRYELSHQAIAYHASNRDQPASLSPDQLSHITLHKIIRPTGKRKNKVPFPWRVRLVDNGGTEFKHEFKFQSEENGRKLAAMLSEFYGVESRRSEA